MGLLSLGLPILIFAFCIVKHLLAHCDVCCDGSNACIVYHRHRKVFRHQAQDCQLRLFDSIYDA